MDLRRDKTVAKIISRLKADKGNDSVLTVAGVWGSFGTMLTAFIQRSVNRPILYLCPHIDDADRIAEDLHTFGGEGVEVFRAWEGQEDFADATDEIRSERLRVILKLLSGQKDFIVTAPVQALCQPIPDRGALEKSSLRLKVDGELSPEEIAAWLIDNSFERVEAIDMPGQFARRGGIVDIYAPLAGDKIIPDSEENISAQSAEAIRIEFFGDCIESIREINLDSHRSARQIESIKIISVIAKGPAGAKELFLDILPKDTIIIFEEPDDIGEVASVYHERLDQPEGLYHWRQIYKAASNFTALYLRRFAGAEAEDFLKLDIKSVQQFQRRGTSAWAGHKESLEKLVQLSAKGKEVQLYCESAAEIKRLKEILHQSCDKLPANFELLNGFVHRGFAVDSLDAVVITHHELFGQFPLRRSQRPLRPSAPVDTLTDLQAGDCVVHLSYGIGKFLGIRTIRQKTGTSEYLTIEYADKVKIHVSINNIALVQKYIGTSPRRPKLSRIGSKRWDKQKEQVAGSVRDLANELLQLQARRQAMGGITFESDSSWQVEFEESFGYQETPDQITTIAEIKSDMQQAIAMDRLLCGDVGYGKTELAMRAAFKAVETGKQVAVLVPTTVLCVQHERTFTERFADFPVSIESLNRFKTTRRAKEIVAGAKKGTVDIVIGTHRLLSGDVGFKNLGLLIIDEEQRFGVEHKEKLKKLRFDVDILTMTATPIPRTLHLSLLGLRDISSLGTPPLDRRSVITNVTSYSSELIKKAIIQELNRQGQVFFLHNRVRTIEKKAWELRKLLADTDVKIAVAHGQMAKSELEKAMIDFVLGKTDVLVCTTIIESGLDIPNANTIFINDADRFGLAELHQLRGRVGRYKHRAYAYMLVPKSRSITPLAARRLKAIEEYSHLGAGFRIALRDLEIRGAGNILGQAQSGHIQIVGYQLYCQLLADAVRKIKNEPVESVPTATIDPGFSTYIPKNYIPSDRHRMDVYRKIAVAKNSDELKQLRDELTDIYGPVPDEVEMLLTLALLRIKADRQEIKSVTVSGQNLVFSFKSGCAGKSRPLFAKVKGRVSVIDEKTVYLRLASNYFEPATLIAVLRKILCPGQ